MCCSDVCTSVLLFFFKQKTAYEIYQCDWSSDVCSSDLLKPEELLRLKTKTLNQLVLTTLFRQEAKKNGISVNNEEFEQVLGQVKSGYEEDSFQRTLQTNDIEQKNWEKNLEDNLLTKNLIDRVVNSRVKVDEDEIHDYFEAHPVEFQKQERSEERRVGKECRSRWSPYH